MLKLIIEDDEGHTTVVPLAQDEITIGRKEGNTVRLTDRNISRHHARLIRSNNSLFIEDLDSYNGVRVNGNRIAARTTIRETDHLVIGDYRLSFRRGDEAEQERASEREITAQVKIEPPQSLAVSDSGDTISEPKDQSSPDGVDTTEPPEEVKEPSEPRSIEESVTNRKPFLIVGALAAVVLIGISVYIFLQAVSSPVNSQQKKKGESRMAEVASSPIEQTSIDFQIGMDRFSARDYGAAMKNFEAALEKDPSDLRSKDMRDRSIKERDAAVALAKVQTLISSQNWDQAIQVDVSPDTTAGKEAIKLRPEVENQYKMFHRKLGKNALDKGRYADALKHAEAILSLDDTDSAANKIKQAAEKSLVANAKKSAGVKNITAALVDTPQTNQAPETLTTGAKPLDANDKQPSETSAAKTPDTSGDKTPDTTAVKAPETKSSKAHEPQDPRGNALKLFNEGKLEEAVVLFQKAIKADPADCALYRYLGTAYAKIGDKGKAYQAFRKFVEVCPNDKQAPMMREIIERYDKEQNP